MGTKQKLLKMIIEKVVTLQDTIMVDITAEDIHTIFCESGDNVNRIICQLNSIAEFLNGIPDKTINQMKNQHKSIFSKFLAEQSQRFSIVRSGRYKEEKK